MNFPAVLELPSEIARKLAEEGSFDDFDVIRSAHIVSETRWGVEMECIFIYDEQVYGFVYEEMSGDNAGGWDFFEEYENVPVVKMRAVESVAYEAFEAEDG